MQDEAKVLNGLAQCFQSLNHTQKAFECYNRSIDIKKSLDDKQGVANSLSNLSMFWKRICEYGKAINTSKEAIKFYNMIENPTGKFRNKTHLAMYQVIVGYFEDAKKNLLVSLSFMENINDYKYIGTVYRYLGLVELNTQNWEGAQNHFIKALDFHQKAEWRPAFETTTLFLGLSYFYDEKYDLADKFITKAIQMTERRINASSFYGKTAKVIQMMLRSKMGKCMEEDVDLLVQEIEKALIKSMTAFSERNFNVESSPIKREYWYISQCYFNLGLNDKFEKFKNLAYDDMIKFSKHIEDKKIRNDYLTLPLLHRKIRGEDLEPIDEQPVKDNDEDKPIKDETVNIFLFCSACGFNNEKQFKFCPKCGTTLSS